MSAILKVALVGATGAIGPSILRALQDEGFEVTILTRDPTKLSDSQAKVVKADYSNLDQLVSILKDQDAVVNAMGATAWEGHYTLLDAALRANVRRYIPSEWGSDITNAVVSGFPGPIHGEKTKFREHLKRAAAENTNFTYTSIINGPFFDWGMEHNLFLDPKGGTIERYNGGDVRFSSTRVSTVGLAVAAVLKHLDETKNREVKIHDGVFTQNQLLKAAERLKGGKFEVSEVNTDDIERQCWELSKDPTANVMAWVYGFIKVAVWGGERTSGEFKSVDNYMLGLKEYEGDELEKLVEDELKKLL